MLDAAWPMPFFRLRNPRLGLIDSIRLWSRVPAMVALFCCISPFAGLLNIPYLLWSGFAVILNGAQWWLNP